jgi:soluble lytic murein transglycosylase
LHAEILTRGPGAKRIAGTLVLALVAGLSAPARCQQQPAQDGSEWDRARAQLIATQASGMGYAIAQWKQLTASDRFSFADYSRFLLTYPGFPLEDKLRGSAERALALSPVDPGSTAAFFDRYPPLSNVARGRYAEALAALGRREAPVVALAAWRGGSLTTQSEGNIFALYGRSFTPADHDARMNALLWAGDSAAAARQIAYVSPAARARFAARLALAQGAAPVSAAAPIPGVPGAVPVDLLGQALPPSAPTPLVSPLVEPDRGDALADAGYVWNRLRRARASGNGYAAVQLLATRPRATVPVLDPQKWVSESLAVAKGADTASAVRIATRTDDALPAGLDISRAAFKLRDDYTSLMWLGGTKALWQLSDASDAAVLFYRYGAAAQTPQTRAKGFYWAGRALSMGAGGPAAGRRYLEMAAAYPDQFYGMLALERLSRPLPSLASAPRRQPSAAERAAFNAKPLTRAVREVAREADWPVTVRFFKEIAGQAESETDHVLVADLAREIGRRDLGVILDQAAHADGYGEFRAAGFPLIPVPPGADWTMVHALSRQESQFAQNAISHAGARGLMQLMPRTAREQAGKIGLSYSDDALLSDPATNLRLGDAYFARMMSYYNGCYPLAVGAYNAGPGNVNRWLAANGDPRTGSVDWVTWIEKIPISETRNYIQRVLENAVVYEAMNPAHARFTGPTPLSQFLGRRTPG